MFGQEYHPLRGGSTFQQEPGTPWIVNFLTTSEDPWQPSNIIPSGGLQNVPSFHDYRSNPNPSDCDTIPDSGYGSNRPPHSIETTSVFEEDRSPETQVATRRIESMHLGPDLSIQSAIAQPRRPASVRTAPVGIEHQHCCPDCKDWFRTKSELTKHVLRHSKPFTCLVPGCSRTEGFGTSNDLDRHKKSVHSDLSVGGHRFICRLGNCATKDKLWPRADNFRQHLKRMHKKELSADDDLDEYIYRPPRNQEPLRQDLKGVGTAISFPNTDSAASNTQTCDVSPFPPAFLDSQTFSPRSMTGFGEIQASLNMLPQSTPTTTEKDASRLPSVQEVEENFVQPESLSGASPRPSRSLDGTLLPLPELSYQYASSDQGSMVEDDNSFMEDNFEPPPPLSENEDNDNSARTSDRDLGLRSDEASASTVVETTDTVMATAGKFQLMPSSNSSLVLPGSPYEFGDRSKVLEYLKTFPKDLLENALKSETSDPLEGSSQSSSNNKNQHACPECKKIFNRQCELKKHKKRHEKPYGCTFSNCSKTFGSKNDWKRHESSQHWQLEFWQCEDMKLNQSGRCTKVFQRRESFKHHLQRDHDMTDVKEIEKKVEKCKIGRHCKPQYWCGFCEKMIEVGSENVNAWTARCDHIDNHFCGRDGTKRHIGEWIHPADSEEQCEDTSTKPQLSQSTKSPNALKRKPSSDTGPKAHKRQKPGLQHMWRCCACNNLTNVQTTSACIQCDHQQCEMFCEIEVHEVHEVHVC